MAGTLRDWRRSCWRAVTVLAMLVLATVSLAGAGGARAQTAAPAASAGDENSATADDLMSLVAPIALYPDPVLALVLQASTQPLQVVQAERFLEKRKKDPKLAPDAGWDRSILGLLNYPSLVEQMNAYLDWTETLGDAVVDRLDDVQGAIQDIRWGAYNTGILVGNQRQKVVAEGDIIRILPADPKTVSIPKYDPKALLAAIEPPVVVEEDVPIPAPATATAAAPSAPAAPKTTPTAPQAAAPPAPADAGYAAAPAYAPAPYAGPPMVSYAEPQTGFWESAATFTGGAIIGGLLGYALADDDDNDDWFDDDDYGGGRNINIEDSTVVVGGGRYDRTQVQNELRSRRGDVERARSRERVGELERGAWQKGGVAPTRQASPDGARPGRAEANRAVRLPNAGTQPALTQQRQPRDRTGQTARQPRAAPAAAAAGFGKREPGDGGVAALQPRSQTRKAAERGARSQSGRDRGGGGQLVAASAGGGDGGFRRASGDGGGGMGGIGRGERAARDADRGRQSRGGGGGGGGGGRGGLGRR